jgi:hypothetical protein
MKYGFVLPFGDARTAATLASQAEAAGWDGFFVWEPVWGIDAWVALAAAAMLTQHIRLGTLLSPLSRMRPWKIASETATLDNLSKGRVILSVGLGAIDTGFEAFGEVTDRRTRAELLDESLDIITGLWRGHPFSYDGKHYKVKETNFYPPAPPLQEPRIPIWVVGAWPRMRSMQRVLRYDGLLPVVMNSKGQIEKTTPEDIHAMQTYVAENRTASTPFDIIVEGQTPGNDLRRAGEIVKPWIDSGATWWIEALWETPQDTEGQELVRQRILDGPPRLS